VVCKVEEERKKAERDFVILYRNPSKTFRQDTPPEVLWHLLVIRLTVQPLKDCSRGTLQLGCRLWIKTAPAFFFHVDNGNLRLQ